jgi:hypothetical protein
VIDKPPNWAELAIACEKALTESSIRTLAENLGVSVESLRALRVGWSARDNAWTFPECDGEGNVIGILRRFKNGQKKVMPGSQRGLYLPCGWREQKGTVYVPEGPSDVAALICDALRAIGRPSCSTGRKHLIQLFANTDDQILIVGENDLKEDGHWPGRDGARKLAAALARELGNRVRWSMPPEGFKDVREFLSRKDCNG